MKVPKPLLFAISSFLTIHLALAVAASRPSSQATGSPEVVAAAAPVYPPIAVGDSRPLMPNQESARRDSRSFSASLTNRCRIPRPRRYSCHLTGSKSHAIRRCLTPHLATEWHGAPQHNNGMRPTPPSAPLL